MGSLNLGRQLGDLRPRLNERRGIGGGGDLIYTDGSGSDDRIFLRGLDLTRSAHLNMDGYDLMEVKGYPPLLIWVTHRVMNGRPLLIGQSGGRRALDAVAPLTPLGESSTLLYGG
jgi:hypothetical protein